MDRTPRELRQMLQVAIAEIHKHIIGQDELVQNGFLALLAGGPTPVHISSFLEEGVPSVGKTTFAKTFGKVLGLEFRRFQFTPDIIATDVIGFHDEKGELKRAILFSNIFLADEINRASPKTQSAFLEAMEEGQVTIEGRTYPLPHPFFVIATMNPIEQKGVFPLAEAALDRFTISFEVGYPSEEVEREIYEFHRDSSNITNREIIQALTKEDIIEMRRLIEKKIYADRLIGDFCLKIARLTRPQNWQMLADEVALGASLRGFWLLRVAAAYAFMQGSEYVTPEHVKAVAKQVLAHRIKLQWRLEAGQTYRTLQEASYVVEKAIREAVKRIT